MLDTEEPKKSRATEKGKKPGIDSLTKPPLIPPGEDEAAYKHHNKSLMIEAKKSRPNGPVVSRLMERSFPFRRSEILNNATDISTLLSKYPFLRDLEQVS